MARTVAPEISFRIEQYFKENNDEGTAPHILAHGILAAAVSAATGNDPTTGALSAMGAEKGATYVAQYLYPDVKPGDLTADQKRTVSSIVSLAGIGVGATTGDVGSAVSAGEAGKVAVEDNDETYGTFFNSLATPAEVNQQIGMIEYCQKNPNSSACKAKTDYLGNYAHSVIDTTKSGGNIEAEAGATAVFGLGVRQSTGVVVDSTGKACPTFTTCGIVGPMAGAYGHTGLSGSTGTATPGSRTWQFTGIADIALGTGFGLGGSANSDGSFTGGGEATIGGALGGGAMICSKKVGEKCVSK